MDTLSALGLAPGEAALLGVITVLALNHAIVRVPAIRDRVWAFWLVNLVDAVAGGLVIALGLPGFDHVPPVRFIVGLLFFLHIAQNIKLKADRDSEARARRKEEILAERRRLKAEAPDEE